MTLPATARTITFIVTRDREAAKAFYGGALGFPLSHEDGFAAVYDMNGVMLRISDTGPGIEPDVLSRVFEPFFTCLLYTSDAADE